MSELHQLQQNFLAYILGQDSDMASMVESTPALSATGRLNLYATAYTLRLKEALITDYEKLHGYIGDEQFEQLMEDYIQHNPSHTTNLRYFSINMPQFLADYDPYQQFPILAEIAFIERAFANSFDAKSEPHSSLNDLAAIPPEQCATLAFKFHPSAQIVDINHNSFATWKALANQETPPETSDENEQQTWLIWRNAELVSHYRPLAIAEAEVIQQTINGGSLAQLCETLLNHFSEQDTPLQAVTLLQSWLQEEMLSELHVD
jgi:hypothetical protein